MFAVLALAVPAVASAAPSPNDGSRALRSSSRGARQVHVPPAGRAVDTSHPDHVIGHGSPAGCTSRAVVRAVAKGGIIRFRCGPKPVVIRMWHTAKVVNTSRHVVIDGGGLVTLDGMGDRRILYQDTCDRRQIHVTHHCEDQAHPRLVVQHITLAHGNSTGQLHDMGGGGAIFDRGGRLKIVDTTFIGNRCDRTGADLGGGAVRAMQQYHWLPLWVVHSTFRGGRCSNGAGLSGLNVSWHILNSLFVGNHAIGYGRNPASPGTPGGGSGGALYADGETYHIRIAGTVMRDNEVNELGGAVFFVSNDLTGTLRLAWSTLEDNLSTGPETKPGIFYQGSGPIDAQHTLIR
jgi:hypothetical protein